MTDAPTLPNYRYVSRKRRTKEDRRFITGRGKFVADVEVPGMRYAAVAPAPITRGTITAIRNLAEVEAMAGVEAVLPLGDVVAVVADNPWRAEQAARKVDMDCQPPAGGLLDEAAFREKLREEGQQRLAAMEAGSILIKFNEGKGMFGRKSDASRMVERWVVLNTKVDFGGPQLAWGDPKTKKISSQVRLGECKCVRYGQQSETLQSFTFNPHSAWLCFSVEPAAGRTFDFAATN